MPEKPTSQNRFEAANRFNEKVFAAKEVLRAERRAMTWAEKIRLIERTRKGFHSFKRPKPNGQTEGEDA